MPTNDLADLLQVVERLRVELHPDLSASFLAAVVRAEETNPDDDSGAVQAIRQALELALQGVGAT